MVSIGVTWQYSKVQIQGPLGPVTDGSFREQFRGSVTASEVEDVVRLIVARRLQEITFVVWCAPVHDQVTPINTVVDCSGSGIFKDTPFVAGG